MSLSLMSANGEKLEADILSSLPRKAKYFMSFGSS